MKKNVLLILTLSMAFASSAWAGPRSWQQAKAIARQEAAKIGITLDENATSSAKANGQTTSNGNASYYVFANNSKGYVIVSGDDEMPDIVGYSTNGTFDERRLPGGYADLLKAYDNMVKAVQQGDRTALRTVAEAKALRAQKTAKNVSPLLENEGIRWNQEYPYNIKCPILDNGDTCVTGCSATALAQMLRFWKHPAELLADIPAYTSLTKHFDMPAIEKGVKYEWDKMLPYYNEYDRNDDTDEQKDAVATLMLHCGCCMEMDYAKTSGSNLEPRHLTHYFGYDKELVQAVNRYSFTLKQWTDIIDNELANGRPVFYAANDKDGGHQFICDGSKEDGLYHINWGWGGYADDYFDITILNDSKPKATSSDLDTDGYTRFCKMIIGVIPDNGKVDEPLVSFPLLCTEADHQDSLIWTKSTRESSTEEFEGVAIASFENTSASNFNGLVAVGLKNTDGTYTRISDYETFEELKPNFYNTFPLSIKYAFEEGTYRLYNIYSTDNGETWQGCSDYDTTPFLITATENEIVTDSALTAEVTYDEDDVLMVGSKLNLTITIKSKLYEEYCGQFLLTDPKVRTDDGKKKKLGSLFVTIPAEGSVTKQVTITPPLAGDMELHLTDCSDRDLKVISIPIADTPSSINTASAETGNRIKGGKGTITAVSSTDTHLAVYNLSGQKVAELSLKAGEQQTITVRPGIYITDGTKVAVK